MKTAIIDYGMGNVASVQKALNYLKIKNIITSNHREINDADAIILPGVGAFKQGMDNLNLYNLIPILNEQVLVKKKPFMGFCLGMQLLATTGTEFSTSNGLGWIAGTVKKINEPQKRIPHLGWNDISVTKQGFLTEVDKKDFYFIHSYHFDIEDKENIAATVNYGKDYVAAVQWKNIFATQFHPEKSQEAGLTLLSGIYKHYA
jgi:glutamine amidotransferase